MIDYPAINPEIVRVGPLAVRWYGMMYLLGFASSYLLVRRQIKQRERTGIRMPGSARGPADRTLRLEEADTLYTYLIVGLLLGARLGYAFFYNFSYYLQHPIEVFAVWHGGMSFHGGFIGSIGAGLLFCRHFKVDFWHAADLVIATAPIGIGLGRLGNFINAELYGRPSDVPWAMVFPGGGPLPRHPSPLYEFFLEGVVLFVVLWTVKGRGLRPGVLTSLFIILYGSFRFLVEFFREPDIQLGFVLGFLTMGQVLSGLMVLAGVLLFLYRKKAS
ncbi:MAG: prolipoprotein diacylglyceryl transferase [Nitrospirales bacterium]|nr:prolipoprotein diacylglyceryl transferase [Nitrospirales bacterium]